ncbi:MAG: aminopeptidase [Lachnospiraceae bacterium]|nr:aminopeptidase [Lachnospiraceae bacterium]
MTDKVLQKYAELIVQCGVNVQKGQYVIIEADIERADLVRFVTEEAYKAGAAYVFTDWSDTSVQRLHYTYAAAGELSKVYPFIEEKWRWKVDNLPCMIYILSDDPDAFSGIDPVKMGEVRAGKMKVIKPYRNRMENKYQWTIVGAAGKAWAKRLFPELPEERAVDKLWQAILATVHMGDGSDEQAEKSDPVAEWAKINKGFEQKCAWINSLGLKELRYRSARGTDFKVGLIKDASFYGGGERSLQDIYYNPNMPTEEIYTSPMKGKAEGRLVATKPLSWQGQLIEDFFIDFEKGKAVRVCAKKGQEALEKLIAMDDTSCYLGEVALVPKESPINKSGILFLNTLFDENAACHVALGQGFSNVLKGFENMTDEEIKKAGINESIIHVDFMIGSADMEIDGVCEDGRIVPIFRNGTWA